MKWSMTTVGVIMLGIIGVAIIMLFQKITTSNENDYYLLKEVTEAAMIDSIDISYYRETGNLKIIREKFVENFTRRFAESTVFVTNGYTIKSYDIMETPPKVSIVIATGLGEYTINGNTDDYNIANKLDAILEYTGKYTNVSGSSPYYNNPYVEKTKEITYYVMSSKQSGNNFKTSYSLKTPTELIAPNIKDIKISSASYIRTVNSQGELGKALMMNEISFNNTKTDYMQSINNFATSVSGVTINSYNCGTSTSEYTCDDNNHYWTTVNGTINDTKNSAILKYKVKWSYKEYEFK